ncbi:hypothetical protein EIN_057800 [Entamoeba invadens IP1]|uniref:hypothetical protein n=1 Tax=Entamoeba invadens IP1 TaxID=370355 RepID=UPI0002C3F58E|nr:hypothetical protein EIN_057800 [Entamoeba invadens IP1]ELP93375.1 hypothetical protein EIN_057800 [Entamoeba invadens IP1]|eukprot:XP_004260146.1 hypothetical protein EIN_057800 [Entamoeba invadens IP1]
MEFVFLLIVALSNTGFAKDVVEVLEKGVDDKRVTFHKSALDKCYYVNDSSSFMYTKDEESLRYLIFSTSDCLGSFTGYTIEYGENQKIDLFTFAPSHIAFSAAAEKPDCPMRDRTVRHYYTKNKFLCKNNYCRYKVEKNDGGDKVLYLITYSDEKCKEEIKRDKIQDCNTCKEGVMYQCAASAVALLFVEIVLLLI